MFEQHTVLVPEDANLRMQWFVSYARFDRLRQQVPAVEPLTFYKDKAEAVAGFAERDESVDFQSFVAVVDGVSVKVLGGDQWSTPEAVVEVEAA
jgi:hypothetical protein